MPKVINYTGVEFIKILDVKGKYEAIEKLASVFENSDVCSDLPGLTKALIEREEIMSTGIGAGIAIPHAKIHSVQKMAFAVGIIKDGVNFDSMDGQPVHIVILVAAGEKQHKEYLRLLSNIMAIIKKGEIKEKMIQCNTPEEVLALLEAEE